MFDVIFEVHKRNNGQVISVDATRYLLKQLIKRDSAKVRIGMHGVNQNDTIADLREKIKALAK